MPPQPHPPRAAVPPLLQAHRLDSPKPKPSESRDRRHARPPARTPTNIEPQLTYFQRMVDGPWPRVCVGRRGGPRVPTLKGERLLRPSPVVSPGFARAEARCTPCGSMGRPLVFGRAPATLVPRSTPDRAACRGPTIQTRVGMSGRWPPGSIGASLGASNGGVGCGPCEDDARIMIWCRVDRLVIPLRCLSGPSLGASIV